MDTKALRQKILDLAIRGKLVSQNPNDEPASVLLERIREQKKQMVKDGKLKPKDIKNDTIIFKGDDSLHYQKLNRIIIQIYYTIIKSKFKYVKLFDFSDSRRPLINFDEWLFLFFNFFILQ